MLHRLRRKLIRSAAWPLYGGLAVVDWLGSRAKSAPRESPALAPFRPGISIVIPERSNPVLLGACLKSVRTAGDLLSEPYEVIVVASGSAPSLYRGLTDDCKSIRWVFSRRALRFSGAIRRGLAVAQYDWVYLLNSDMVLDPAALVSLVPWRSPSVFGIASQIYFQDPAKRREETGWTAFRTAGGPIEILDQLPEDDSTVRGTFYAGGGASLFRRELLARFSEDSSVYDPFYWEDAEWGARAWRSGYEVLFCPASKVWHAHRATNRRFFSEGEIDRIQQRNRLVFHLRNGPSIRSLAEFDQTIATYHWRSLLELMSPRRSARILCGRWRNRRLPFSELALEYTWRKYYLQPPQVSPAKPCMVIVTPYALFPPSHGGARRIHAILEALCRRFQIVLLSDEADLYGEASTPYFKGLSSVHLAGGRRDDAYPNDRTGRIAAHSHPVLAGHLRFLIGAYQPAIVQIEYVELSKLVEWREGDSPHWCLTAHDVLLSEDGSETVHDAHELQWLGKFDAVIACSEEDARMAPHQHVFTIPNGAALDDAYTPSPERAPILFLGPFRYAANFRGIQEFLELCWTGLRRRVPWAELYILGGGGGPRMASELECFKRDGVRVMGYVENPREWLDRSSLTINPLQDVRGSCLKVIESLAAGRVCVSTKDGARGYADRGFEGLVVVASVADFVEPLERLLLDVELRRSVEPPPLPALRAFSWKRVAEAQAAIYQEWLTKS